MTISDEMLMAFSEGELSGVARETVERAMRENPEIAMRVARHRALRQPIKLAYSAKLSANLTDAALASARRAPGDKVISLTEVRAAQVRAGSGGAGRSDLAAAPQRSWRPLASIAVGVLLGLIFGYAIWYPGGVPIARNAAGSLIASGSLKSALSEQLVAQQAPSARIRIGVSFQTKSGEYCRSFALLGSTTGIACRHAGEWHIQALLQNPSAESGDRSAGAGMPPLLLQSMAAQIVGEPLSASAEMAARQRGWQLAGP